MTIQISITIWTVICFCLLMVILRHLLFGPVLRVMDARKQKIEQAARKQAEYEAMVQEHQALTKQQAADYEKKQKQLAEQQLEEVRMQSKQALIFAQEQRLKLVEDYRVQAEQMHEDILQTLQGHTAKLAADFAQNLIKDSNYGN